ncbi:DMT family transporter [bacterium]|nr:MAG: DMT family transporter [bacterium]
MLLVFLSSAWFSASALLIKALGPDVPVAWVVFCRNAVALAPVAALMHRRGIGWRTKNTTGLVMRGVWGVGAMVTGFWAIPRLPMANATLLMYASPLYAALLGAVFLDEPVARSAAGYIALSFVGLFLAVPPLAGAAVLPTAAAFASGLFSGLAFTALRQAASTDEPIRVVFYYALIGSGLFLVPAALSGVVPSPRQTLLLLAVGGASTVGQLLMSSGFGKTPVAKASLATLVSVVLNFLGGWALWGEKPSAATWAGCALILFGILGLSEAFRKRLLLAAPA